MTTMQWEIDRGRVPAALDQWTAPGLVEIANGQLRWSHQGGRGWRTVTARPDLLDRFIRLADAPDALIQNFAENFGVLYLCEHNRAASHLKTDGPATLQTGGFARCDLRMISADLYEEPLSVWRDWSRKMGAAVRLALHLHGRSPTNREDWLILFRELQDAFGSEEKYRTLRFSSSIEDQRHSLSLFVSGCLHEGQVELSFGWIDQPVVSLGGRTLFAALSTRLLLAVSRTEGLALCSSCRTPFIPKRHPRLGERQYCSTCGNRAAQRDASADYRLRRKSGQQSIRRRAQIMSGGEGASSPDHG